MYNFIANIALMNMLGGRFASLFGDDDPRNGRLIFRCLLPGLAAAFFAAGFSHHFLQSACIGAMVMAGSGFWFVFGWSHDEITGEYDPNKYPAFIQRIGLRLFPINASIATNRKRGIVMKGIRGLYDIFTFGLLAIFNPAIMLLWPATAAMGLVYWLGGHIAGRYGVMCAEFLYGIWRGVLIAWAIILCFNGNGLMGVL